MSMSLWDNPWGRLWGRALALSLCAVSFAATPALAQEGSGEEEDVKKEAAAEEPVKSKFKRHVWRYQNASYVRLNPIGLINASQAGYRYMLYNSEEKLLKDSYVSLAFAPNLSPSFTGLGAQLEIKPLAVLVLSARYEWINYFGTFGTVTSAASPSASHSDTDRNDAQDNDTNFATTGTILTLGALLQAKVGDIAVRTHGKLFQYDIDIPSGDKVFYDITPDTLIKKDGGMVLTVDTDVLYLADKLTIGLRHTLVQPQYEDSDFLPGESTDHDNDHMRIGPLIAYRFDYDPDSNFREPTLFSLINWYIDHRHRTGDDVSQAMPYIVLGFAFNGNM